MVAVCFLAASILALALTRGVPLMERVKIFSRGAATENIMLMIWVFLLAGAFAMSAKSMGAIDATVGAMLTLLPEGMLLPGIFLATCFISLSVGTSVGTIVAMTPIAAMIASETGSSSAMMVAAVVGGAFFGDNLSFISDTTIVATSTQGCRMDDKFKTNIWIAAPAALAVMVLYCFIGINTSAPSSLPEVDTWKVVPYLAVFFTALCGMNVLSVLLIGLLLTGIVGIATGGYTLEGWVDAMGQGMAGMGELIIVTLLAGGLFAVIRHNGGIEYIIEVATRRVHGRRGAEFTIGMLVAAVDVCTANNTVAILTVGDIARDISQRFGVDPRRTASILDTCSCIAQCIIPYGIQLLLAAQLANVTPLDIIPHLYYAFALAAMVLISIIRR